MDPDIIPEDPYPQLPPPIPPRSPYYCLEPIGIGTPFVESLTSYVTRLAAEHSITVGGLIKRGIAPIIGKNYYTHNSNNVLKIGVKMKDLGSINGIGTYAHDWAMTLKSLTLRHDLILLTMLPFAHIFTDRGLIEYHKKWCPKCYGNYDDCIKHKNIVYDPLLWKIKSVRWCQKHHIPLVEKCPRCDSHVRHLSAHSLSGHCTECGVWLGLPCETSIGHLENKNDNKEIWISNSTGEILTHVAEISASITTEQISNTIRSCIELFTNNNREKYSKYCNISYCQLETWCQGANKANLDSLLKCCVSMNISLMEFLNGNVSCSEEDRKRLIADGIYSYEKRKRAQCGRIDKKKALSLLTEALNETEKPPSVPEVARRIGCSHGQLHVLFPDICRKIGQLHKEYLERISDQNNETVRNMIISIIEDYEKKGGVPPTRETLAKELKCDVSLLYIKFPDLVYKVSELNKNYQRHRNNVRREEKTQEIFNVCDSLVEKGIYPSFLQVRKVFKGTDLGGNFIKHTIRNYREEHGIPAVPFGK